MAHLNGHATSCINDVLTVVVSVGVSFRAIMSASGVLSRGVRVSETVQCAPIVAQNSPKIYIRGPQAGQLAGLGCGDCLRALVVGLAGNTLVALAF